MTARKTLVTQSRARLATLLLTGIAATASLPAHAGGDVVVGTLFGAGAGALVGQALGGNQGAVVGGVIGAVAGNAIASSDHRPVHYGGYPQGGHAAYGATVHYRQPGWTTYHAPAPQVVWAPPPPVHYAPAPVYVAPRPIYYPPPAVVYSPAPHHYYRGHHHHKRHHWD